MRAHALTASAGHDAGQPRNLTDVVLDRLAEAKLIVTALKMQGYAVLDVKIMGACEPVIEVGSCPQTMHAIATESACYYMRVMERDGSVEMRGQFKAGKCRVIWREPLREGVH